jgi:hypothetical protein
MSDILEGFGRQLTAAISPPMTFAVERAFADNFIGLDGFIYIPSHMEQTGRYIANVFDMVQKTRISARYVNGVYRGVDCLDFNIPSTKGLRGMYLISYHHPITGERSFYIGTTIRDPRDRIGKFVRMISTGIIGKDENGAASKKWISKHGMTLDYASAVFIPIDMPQKKLRELEGWVTKNYRDMYPGTVLNTVVNPTLTLEKRNESITPPLLGI